MQDGDYETAAETYRHLLGLALDEGTAVDARLNLGTAYLQDGDYPNGVDAFRQSIKLHRPRGFFCGIGRCSSCNVIVDGVPDVRACVTLVRDGMDVRTQKGRGEIGGG